MRAKWDQFKQVWVCFYENWWVQRVGFPKVSEERFPFSVSIDQDS